VISKSYSVILCYRL